MDLNFASFFNQMASRLKDAPAQATPDYIKLMTAITQNKLAQQPKGLTFAERWALQEQANKSKEGIAGADRDSRDENFMNSIGQKAYASAIAIPGATPASAEHAEILAKMNYINASMSQPTWDREKAKLKTIGESRNGIFGVNLTYPQDDKGYKWNNGMATPILNKDGTFGRPESPKLKAELDRQEKEYMVKNTYLTGTSPKKNKLIAPAYEQ